MLPSSEHAKLQCVSAVSVVGFSTTITQILVLREILVLFYGNELSAGLVFAGWLGWNALGSWLAAKWSRRMHVAQLGAWLVALAVLSTLSVMTARASGILWSIPVGELPKLGKMLAVSLTMTALFSPLSGFLFGISWALYRGLCDTAYSGRPIIVYLAEALGAAAGGLVFYFILLPKISTYGAIWLTSITILVVSGIMIKPWRPSRGKMFAVSSWFGIFIIFLAGAVWSPEINRFSRRWQWGEGLAALKDTAYHRIVILQEGLQLSVLINGVWLFSAPDRISSEISVHPALLQHPYPRKILFLGGGIAGQLAEALKHPTIERVDYVEPDPDFIPFVKRHLPASVQAVLSHPYVYLHQTDARTFIRGRPGRYDVVIMNTGDPVNAQMNRFYTKEFFSEIKACLAPGGVFSFAVSGGADMIGPMQARYLASFYRTLQQEFSRVKLFPGDNVRFFAGDETSRLSDDVHTLVERLSSRKLSLSHFRKEFIEDVLNPFRLEYLYAMLEHKGAVKANRDYTPTCYFQHMIMWSSQWHPQLQRYFLKLAQVTSGQTWLALLAAGTAGLLLLRSKTFGRYQTAIGLSVLTVGGSGMVIQLILLLGFQIVAGYVYTRLAVMIALFMAGLAGGAAVVAYRLKMPSFRQIKSIDALAVVQLLFVMLPAGIIGLLFLLQGELQRRVSGEIITWIFSVVAGTTGILGGAHFSLATLCLSESEDAAGGIGGRLYALDLVGAAIGVLAATFFFIPVLGLIHTLSMASALTFISLLTYFKRNSS